MFLTHIGGLMQVYVDLSAFCYIYVLVRIIDDTNALDTNALLIVGISGIIYVQPVNN